MNPKKTSGKSSAQDETLTELVFLLDRSGSMAGLEADTIGGYNALIAQHKQQKGRAVLSTVLFDHKSQVLHDRVDIQAVKPLTTDDYYVRGSTALHDAIAGAIRHISLVQRYMPEGHRPSKTIFVITTDGMENASRYYAPAEVDRLISECEHRGWEFLFLGANVDAASEAAKLGINPDRAASYVSDDQGTAVLYEALAQATCTLRSEDELSSDWKGALTEDLLSRS